MVVVVVVVVVVVAVMGCSLVADLDLQGRVRPTCLRREFGCLYNWILLMRLRLWMTGTQEGPMVSSDALWRDETVWFDQLPGFKLPALRNVGNPPPNRPQSRGLQKSSVPLAAGGAVERTG
jgi:hypothetical protein